MGFALTSKLTAFCSVPLFSVYSAAPCPNEYTLPGKLEADIGVALLELSPKAVVICGMFPSLPITLLKVDKTIWWCLGW